jgi:hypothetical protein
MTCDLVFDFPANQSVIYGVTCIEQFFHEWYRSGVEYSIKQFTHTYIEVRAVFPVDYTCDQLFDKCNKYFEALGVAIRCTKIVYDGMVYTLITS